MSVLVEKRNTATPLPVIWSRLIDVENRPSWTASMTRIERLGGGPLRVGSTARIHQPKGRPTIWEVIALVDGHEFTWQNRQSGIITIGRHVLTATPPGTHVMVSLEHRGTLAWLARLVAHRWVAEYVRMEADGLAGPVSD